MSNRTIRQTILIWNWILCAIVVISALSIVLMQHSYREQRATYESLAAYENELDQEIRLLLIESSTFTRPTVVVSTMVQQLGLVVPEFEQYVRIGRE